MTSDPEQQPRTTVRLSRAARRAQLLDAGREVFVNAGFHAASMDDIALAAGVSKPVLYQHFSSKLAFYRALLEKSAQHMVRLVREAIASTEDNADRVQRAVQAYFTFISDEEQASRLIFESDLRDKPDIAAIVDSAIDTCISAITDTITADTGADPASARLLAAGLVGLSQVGARYWLAQGADVTRSQAVALLSTLAWRGISYFPRSD